MFKSRMVGIFATAIFPDWSHKGHDGLVSPLHRIRRRQPELRVRFEVRGDAVGAGQRDGDEVHRLLQAVVGFGATEVDLRGPLFRGTA